jgi:hypothetical protein
MRWEVVEEQHFQKDPGSISKWCGQTICDAAYMKCYGVTEQEYADRHQGWPPGSEMICLQFNAWKLICERAGMTFDELMNLCKLRS